MNTKKYIKYLSEGKDPYKEEFNLVAKILDNYVHHEILNAEEKLAAVENIVDSMLNREHTNKKFEDKSQLKLGL